MTCPATLKATFTGLAALAERGGPGMLFLSWPQAWMRGWHLHWPACCLTPSKLCRRLCLSLQLLLHFHRLFHLEMWVSAHICGRGSCDECHANGTDENGTGASGISAGISICVPFALNYSSFWVMSWYVVSEQQ
jgi:hypothetical protein